LENCQELFHQVPETDVLVNNAGFGYIGDFVDCPLSKELDMIDLNIKTMHILTKLYLPGMAKRKKGYILNVASIAGFLPGPQMVTYYATKAYVVRFTQGLAEEMRQRKTGVYVGALCPGPVDTRFNETAGCDFKPKSMTSKQVANIAIRGMWRRKIIIVPGFSTKMVRVGTKLCTDRFLGRMASRMQLKKQNKK
jgi:short-subunit dehydrogenase